MTPTPSEAADALTAMRTSRARLAQAADCPPWRHALFGAMMGGIVATPALSSTYALIAEAFLLVLIVVVVRSDRRRSGMFINGYRSGRTRPIALTMVVIFLVLYGLGFWLAHSRGIYWAPVALGGLTAIAGYGASVQWQRVFKREMGVEA